MAAGRFLIVNADDLGLSPAVNAGIFEAHEHGIVTSASLMVRQPAAAEAAAEAKAFPELSVGLHVDLGEWTYRDGEWVAIYEVLPEAEAESRDAVAAEVDVQLAAFRRLTGRDPTHLDSHQHVHQDVRVRAIVEEAARRLEVPLRHDGKVLYCGDFYGQDEHGLPYHDGICAAALERIVRAVQPGVTEVACHPGYDDGLETMYRVERAMEVAALCDPTVRRAVEENGVRLVNFGEIGRQS